MIILKRTACLPDIGKHIDILPMRASLANIILSHKYEIKQRVLSIVHARLKLLRKAYLITFVNIIVHE